MPIRNCQGRPTNAMQLMVQYFVNESRASCSGNTVLNKTHLIKTQYSCTCNSGFLTAFIIVYVYISLCFHHEIILPDLCFIPQQNHEMLISVPNRGNVDLNLYRALPVLQTSQNRSPVSQLLIFCHFYRNIKGLKHFIEKM